MNAPSLSRRRLLHAFGGLLALAGLPVRALRADSCPVSIAAVRGCVDDVPHAAALGRAWLAAQPAASTSQVALLAGIGESLARTGAAECTTMSIRAAIARDYRDGEAEWAGDWWLSRTEARVYAVLALDSAGGGAAP